MTKADLIKALEKYPDEIELYSVDDCWLQAITEIDVVSHPSEDGLYESHGVRCGAIPLNKIIIIS